MIRLTRPTGPKGAPSRRLWAACLKVGVTQDEALRLFDYVPCATCFDLFWFTGGPSVHEIPTESGWPEPATRVCERCDVRLCEDHADDHAEGTPDDPEFPPHPDSIYELDLVEAD